MSCFGNYAKCWHWTLNEIQDYWFEEKSGYDLEATQEHSDFGEHSEKVLEGLASVNVYLRDNQKKLDKLTADIEKLGPLALYRSIFELMKKQDMEYDHFLQKNEPPADEWSEDHAYGAGTGGYLVHLRPVHGRMLKFRDADGKMVKTALKTCSRCN